MALNNKNRNINNLYLKHIQKPDVDAKTKDFYLKYDNTLKQSDSLTQNGEGGIIKRNSYSVATSRYVNKNDPLFINSKKIPPLPGFEDIVSHGDEYSIVFKDTNGNESNVSAKEFVEFLKQDENYKGGNIRLISCETGKGDGIVPQYIANELGVDVLAPTDLVWVFDDGEMYVAYDMDNALAGINTGEWKLFKPKRK